MIDGSRGPRELDSIAARGHRPRAARCGRAGELGVDPYRALPDPRLRDTQRLARPRGRSQSARRRNTRSGKISSGVARLTISGSMPEEAKRRSSTAPCSPPPGGSSRTVASLPPGPTPARARPAMLEEDSATGRSRGWVVLSRLREPGGLSLTCRGVRWSDVAEAFEVPLRRWRLDPPSGVDAALRRGERGRQRRPRLHRMLSRWRDQRARARQDVLGRRAGAWSSREAMAQRFGSPWPRASERGGRRRNSPRPFSPRRLGRPRGPGRQGRECESERESGRSIRAIIVTCRSSLAANSVPTRSSASSEPVVNG